MRDLTTGSIAGLLLKTSSWMLFAIVIQGLYFLVDLYWVSRLGSRAVAAVAISANLGQVVMALTQMLAVGTVAVLSQVVGRQDRAGALVIFNQSHVLATLVGVLFLVIAMTMRTTYAGALGADGPTAALADQYLRWCIPAMALQFGVAAIQAALRATGDFKTAAVAQAATVLMNMVLAPVLIFGWGTNLPLGVAGAGLATLISVALGTLWLVCHFASSTSYLRLASTAWSPQPALWSRIVRTGAPAGGQFVVTAIYSAVLYSVSRPFGASAQAACGIGLRLMQAAVIPVIALGLAVAPVAGQNLGAARLDRVRGTFIAAVKLAFCEMLVLTAICQIMPASMMRMFSNDQRVVAIGEEYVRIISWTHVSTGIIYVGSGMLQGLGKTVFLLIPSILRLGVVALPVLLLSRLVEFQLRWVWLLSVAANWTHTAVILLVLRRELSHRSCMAAMDGAVPAGSCVLSNAK